MHRKSYYVSSLILIAMTALIWSGCATDENAPLLAPYDASVSNAIPANASDMARVMAVQNRHALELEAIDGVFGTATGRDASGEIVVIAMAERSDVRGIPTHLEGVPVRRIITDRPTLFPKPDNPGGGNGGGGGDKVDFKSRVDRPVPVGYSIGNYLECASGTYGAGVNKGGNLYVLSNNHVLSRQNAADNGEPIGQPGLFDNKPQCSGYWADTIASVSQFVPVQTGTNANNKVDAAIAISNSNMISCSTPSKYYGFPGTPTEAQLDMAIKKVGRTSAQTTAVVIGLNATVTIAYAGANTRFVDQVLTSSGFSKSGDSGSLIVTNDSNADPVGLLFAGNRQGYTWCNRIQNVLSALNISICNN